MKSLFTRARDGSLMTSASKPYRHKPLTHNDEVRFITILPGQDEDPVKVKITHARLSEEPRYAALSYVWGDPQPRHTIWIGKETLDVGPNLYKALRRLRTPSTTMTVWTDAICINQADIPEKNVQIQLMTVLYPKASRVVCWLGEDDGTVGTAFALLEQWADASNDDQQALKQSLVAAAQTYIADPDSSEKRAFNNLFDRPYFRRAWILQEVCVSPSRPPLFVCGVHQMTFSTLSLGFYTLARSLVSYEAARLLGDSVEYVLPMLKLFGFGETRFAVSALLPTVATREAHNPLDRIYAYYGLFSRAGPSYPAPDYSLPVEQVFIDYTRASIRFEKRLDLLHSVDTQAESDHNIPTWAVKPYRMKKTYAAIEKTDLNRDIARSLRRFADARDSESGPLLLHSDDSRVLRLRGLHVAKVTSVHAFTGLVDRLYTTPRSWQQAMRILEDFLEQSGLREEHSEAGSELLQTLLDCITCGGFFLTSSLRDHERHLDMQHAQFVAAYLRHRASKPTIVGEALTEEELMELAKKCIGFGAISAQGSTACSPQTLATVHWIDETAASMLANEVDQATSQRVPAATEPGHLALVHDSARCGDEICMLLGSTVPYVVRRLGGESAQHSLISDAYVPGIMYGGLFTQTGTSIGEYNLV